MKDLHFKAYLWVWEDRSIYASNFICSFYLKNKLLYPTHPSAVGRWWREWGQGQGWRWWSRSRRTRSRTGMTMMIKTKKDKIKDRDDDGVGRLTVGGEDERMGWWHLPSSIPAATILYLPYRTIFTTVTILYLPFTITYLQEPPYHTIPPSMSWFHWTRDARFTLLFEYKQNRPIMITTQSIEFRSRSVITHAKNHGKRWLILMTIQIAIYSEHLKFNFSASSWRCPDKLAEIKTCTCDLSASGKCLMSITSMKN